MKRLLMIGLLICFPISLCAQHTVQELTKGCGQFVDAKKYVQEQVVLATQDGAESEMATYELRNILNLNVIPYYGIKGYDTELKRELYKETEEYKQLETRLKEFRDVIKKTSFFYIHKLGSNYSIEKSGFLYAIELYEGAYVNFPGYINHGTLCIEYATKRFPKNKIEVVKRFGGSDYFYNQKVYLPVKDKQVALKIEEAGRNNVGALFIFKIDSVKDEKILFSTQSFVLTKTEGIYIVNTQTGEVYCKVL